MRCTVRRRYASPHLGGAALKLAAPEEEIRLRKLKLWERCQGDRAAGVTLGGAVLFALFS